MSATPDHGKLDVSVQGVHRAHQWEYANSTARLAATGFVSTDVGKLALQTDTNALYILTAITPTWVAVGTGAGGPPTGTAGGDLTGSYPNPTVNIDGKTGKTTPADADETFLADSASSFATKKLTWANIKAGLKTYFDSLYATLTHTTPVAVASGASHAAGHVPDPGVTGGTTKFLREDMTYAVPPGSAPSASPTVVAETSYGQSTLAGATGGYSDGGHSHGSPAHDAHANTTGITANDHHAQLHKAAHLVGGGDAFVSTDEINLQAIQSHLRVGATGAPATSAALDVDATDGAILIPRMTTTQRNALTAVAGMVIYNTTTATFQRYDGAWADFGTSGVSPLTVKEIDGTPSVAGVTTLQVTNGTLTDNGSGNVTLTIAAGSSYNDPAESLAFALVI